MTLVLANLLRGFGQFATPPATPTLSVADNGDGTGAVATIGGSDVGSTNTVYVAPLAGTPGNLGFAALGSGSGDGNLALDLPDGAYEAYCLSTAGGLGSGPSNIVVFRVTGGPPSATSVLALSKQQLIRAVSESASFQAARGVAAAADALPAIHLSAFLAKDDQAFAAARPFAVVGTHAELGYVQDAGGDKNYLLANGVIYLYLTANDAHPTNPADGSLAFDNFVGGVMDDLEAIAAYDDHLQIRQLHLEGWAHSDEDRRNSQRPFWSALVRVEWGG